MNRFAPWVVVLAFVAGCGIPLQTTPDTIDVEVRSPAASPPAAGIGPGETAIYLVMDDALVPVRRDGVVDIEGLIGLLLAGPSAAEEQAGMRSAIPPNTALRSTEVTGNDIVVDLSRAFASFGGQEEILAVAQVVLTLTTAGLEGVLLELESEATPIPLQNGLLVTEPVGFDDYSALIGG